MKHGTLAHILIIEDDSRIATALQKNLRENQFEVSLAYEGHLAMKMLRQYDIDLVITDIMLPGISGIDLCKQIRKIKGSIPILMLTALGTIDDKLEGFDAGADDYLVKPFEIRELVARIKALLKRTHAHAAIAEVLQYADIVIDTKKRIAYRGDKQLKLTPKEFNLLEYMVKHAERVLPRQEIAENVWNTKFDTGTNFIDVYINYLRKKVDKDFDRKLIHTRQGVGFILMKPEDN